MQLRSLLMLIVALWLDLSSEGAAEPHTEVRLMIDASRSTQAYNLDIYQQALVEALNRFYFAGISCFKQHTLRVAEWGSDARWRLRRVITFDDDFHAVAAEIRSMHFTDMEFTAPENMWVEALEPAIDKQVWVIVLSDHYQEGNHQLRAKMEGIQFQVIVTPPDSPHSSEPVVSVGMVADTLYQYWQDIVRYETCVGM